MKKFAITFGTVCVSALALAATAFGWHANGVTVTAPCDTVTGTYLVSATIIQNAQYPATLKSVSPSSFPGTSTGGLVTVVVKFTNNETQTFTQTVTLDGKCKTPPPPSPKCPAGYTEAGKSEGVLLCTKETVRTETVTVNTTTPGPTVYVDKPGPTVTVEKIVEKLVPGPTVTKTITKFKTKVITKVKTKIKTVTRTIIKAKKCPIPVPGVHTGPHPGVEGSG